MSTGGVLTPGIGAQRSAFAVEQLEAGIDEAHEAGVRVATHAIGAEGIGRALRAGVDSVEHGCYLTDESLKLMAENGSWLVATLVAPERILHGGEGVPGLRATEVRGGRAAHRDSFRQARSRPVCASRPAPTPARRSTSTADSGASWADARLPGCRSIGCWSRRRPRPPRCSGSRPAALEPGVGGRGVAERAIRGRRRRLIARSRGRAGRDVVARRRARRWSASRRTTSSRVRERIGVGRADDHRDPADGPCRRARCARRRSCGKLAEQHRVLLYDRRGTGSSEKPGPPYTTARDSRDLGAMMDALELRDVVVLGMGIRGPRWRCTSPVTSRTSSRAVVLRRGDAAARRRPRVAVRPEEARGPRRSAISRRATIPPPARRSRCARMGRDGREAAIDILSHTRDEDLRPFLPKVTPPTLVIQLSGDPLVPFEAARWLAESLPNGALELFEAGARSRSTRPRSWPSTSRRSWNRRPDPHVPRARSRKAVDLGTPPRYRR